jgi:hypothetical protein
MTKRVSIPGPRLSAPPNVPIRSHGAENLHRVFITGQKRGVFGVIKRELWHRTDHRPHENLVGRPRCNAERQRASWRRGLGLIAGTAFEKAAAEVTVGTL